jgi:transporter family-2 protein
MDRALALFLTLLVGGMVAFQPPANALLARHVGDLGAAFTSLLLSTLIVGVLLVAAGEVSQLRGLTGFRPEHALGAIAGAAIVLVSLVTVRSLGALGVTAALVVMQLTVSAVIDRFGILGLDETPLSPARVAGVVLLIAGTLLVTSR